MSEASYTAWDDNLYEWPPPGGWYQASDGRWWPEGYGPGAVDGADAEEPATASGPATNGTGPASYDPAPYESHAPESHAPAEVPDHGTPVEGHGADGPAAFDVEPLVSPEPLADGVDHSSDPTFDPDRTSLLPAGGFTVAEPAPVTDRDQAETRRRVYDELPPIDDVFGGIDPYATETPVERPAPSGADPQPSSDDGGWSGLGLQPPPLDDEHAFDSAFDRVAESLRAERADGSGRLDPGPAVPANRPEPPAPDLPVGGSGPAGTDAGSANGWLSDRSAAPSPAGPSAFDRPDPIIDPDATRVTESPYRAGDQGEGWSGRFTPDDGATAPIDREAIRAVQETGSGFDAGRTAVSSDGPPEVPALEGRFELPENLAGYVGTPSLERRSGPRRWWPLVVLGIAVVAAAGSIGAYLLLRDNSPGPTADGDAASTGQGAFADPYPTGIGVVVFYNDEASADQRRWIIQVLDPVVDATDTLVDEASADRPPDGEVLARVRIRVAYQSGPEPASVSDLRFHAVGSAPGIEFGPDAACSAVDDPIDLTASLAALESVEGNLCWRVPAGELDSLKLAVEAGPAAGTVHLALK